GRDVRQVVESVRGGDRELRRVGQTRIPEPAHSMHLERGHKSIPVRYGTPAGPGMQVDSAQSEGRRNQGRAGEMGAGDDMVRLLAHVERLAIENELGVELAGAPTVQNRSDGGIINVQ